MLCNNINMHSKRIIVCLDIKNNRVVKGVKFLNLKDAGDPVKVSKKYYEEGADEIVFLDISASKENKNNCSELAKKVSKVLFIPFTVGGGLRNIEDIKNALESGADKVSLNTIAVKNPKLISKAKEKFGSQAIVIAIDAKYNPNTKKYDVYINGGKDKTKLEALSWAKKVEKLGAGEILLTSMDKDGTKSGYDLRLTSLISKNVSIPVIASGGAGKQSDIKDVLKSGKGDADASLLASLVHYGEIKISELKKYLDKNKIKVRK